MRLHWTDAADATSVAAASKLFDEPVDSAGAQQFLNATGHHLCIAYLDDEPVGFVSGIEVRHPDKAPEMMLYELGVDDDHRRRGIARALVGELEAHARRLGCAAMFVLTEQENTAAVATYRSAGAGEPSQHVMFDWDLTQPG